MNKIVLIFAFFTSLVKASVGNLNQNIQCLDAAGYYGNIEIVRTSNSMIQVKAAQGFAYEITKQLRFPLGQEASELTFQFHPNSCRILNNLLNCSGMVLVEAQQFGKKLEILKADTYLYLLVGPTSNKVSLSIKVAGTTRFGSALHTFSHPLGDCQNVTIPSSRVRLSLQNSK